MLLILAMEADAAAACVEALQLWDDSVANAEEVAEAEESVEVAAAKSKKKKKKKKADSNAAALEPLQVLPSQKLVESLFPWKTVIRPSRGRCAVATR